MKPISHYLKKAFSCRSGAIARKPSDRPGPDFICFGMQKGGTRWLYEQMNAREDVWMPPIKEINYFTKRCLKVANLKTLERKSGSLPLITHPAANQKQQEFCRHFSTFHPSRSDLGWYRALFDHKEDRLSGDVSPSYSEVESGDIRMIANELPRTKFILLIREPVDRVWSALCMDLRKNKRSEEQITNWDTLLPMIIKKKREMKSQPSKLWKRWSAEIPADRIRYWFFDDICAQPQMVVDEICEFLAINPGPGTLAANFNSKQGKKKIVMPDHIRMKLTEHYADEIEACAATFGGHAIRWREKRLGSGT